MNDIKNEILISLNTLIGILNNVTVSGEQNCDNISGSIKIIRELCGTVNKCEIEKKDEKPVLAKRTAKED